MPARKNRRAGKTKMKAKTLTLKKLMQPTQSITISINHQPNPGLASEVNSTACSKQQAAMKTPIRSTVRRHDIVMMGDFIYGEPQALR
jgi:hypothetical protein